MKILAISGSYRKGKTIDTLLDDAVKGLERFDPLAEVEVVRLVDKRIEYCTNCMVCRNDDPGKPMARCVIQDDMQELYPKMNDADGFIFATPVNCGTVTAVLKAFIERSVWVFARPGTKPLRGCPCPRTDKRRTAMFIVSSGLVPPVLRMFCDDATKLLKDFVTCSFTTTVVAAVYAGAVEKRGAAFYSERIRRSAGKLVATL